MSHTPTPWLYEITSDHAPAFIYVENSDNDLAGIAIADCKAVDLTYAECDANAAFIVRACNAHDELVAALEQSKEYTAELESRHASALSGWTEYKNLADELAAALEAMTDRIECAVCARMGSYVGDEKLIATARAALAKVKP
jgi:hypothetical protein